MPSLALIGQQIKEKQRGHIVPLNRVKPMYDRRMLVISSKDMEATEFDPMRKATEAIDVGERVIRYVRNNRRDFLKDKNSEGFFIMRF